MLTGEISGRIDFDLETEKSNQDFVLKAITDGLVSSAHDLAEGGLAIALAESAFAKLIETAGIQLLNSTTCYPSRHQAGDAGLPLLRVENELGCALIALQGAQLLSFQARGEREMLWLSPKCVLEAGTPIRGGIPLCMPWFGPGPDGKSAHGFARHMAWSLVAAEILEDGATSLALELDMAPTRPPRCDT